MANAKARHVNMVKAQSKTLDEAVIEYQRRYRRPPPPGFDAWFKYVKSQNVAIIDDYDIVTKSFEPYWNFSPATLRENVGAVAKKNSLNYMITIRNGNITAAPKKFFLFEELTRQIEPFLEYLPDIKAPILLNRFDNIDLARVVMPHELLESQNQSLSKTKLNTTSANTRSREFHWADLRDQYTWHILTLSCSPDAVGSKYLTSTDPAFIADIVESKDICSHPEYRHKHGVFSFSRAHFVTHEPIPIFSGSKLSVNQDILLPSPYYSNDFRRYSAPPEIPWHSKENLLYWAGSTTGMHATDGSNWHENHRTRFVKIANDVGNGEITLLKDTAANSMSPYKVPMASQKYLFNVTFSKLVQCEETQCNELKDSFHLSGNQDHMTHYKYRFLFDVDGNSFSGRFYRLLESNATVLKQTLFQEWHDDFLLPWVHYVPVSLDMAELPEIMRFFAETDRGKEKAWEIAKQGGEWARTALRREDCGAVVFRMLLEYARLVDDNRENLKCC